VGFGVKPSPRTIPRRSIKTRELVEPQNFWLLLVTKVTRRRHKKILPFRTKSSILIIVSSPLFTLLFKKKKEPYFRALIENK